MVCIVLLFSGGLRVVAPAADLVRDLFVDWENEYIRYEASFLYAYHTEAPDPIKS